MCDHILKLYYVIMYDHIAYISKKHKSKRIIVIDRIDIACSFCCDSKI